MRWWDGITNSVFAQSLSRLLEIVEDRECGLLQSMGLQSQTGLSEKQQLLYNVVLVSAIQQHKLAIIICVSSLPPCITVL